MNNAISYESSIELERFLPVPMGEMKTLIENCQEMIVSDKRIEAEREYSKVTGCGPESSKHAIEHLIKLSKP